MSQLFYCSLAGYRIVGVPVVGRAIHPNKRGKIPDELPPILQRLGINPDRLLRYLNRKERGFYLMLGTPQSFQQAVASLGRQFFKGISAANRLFASQPR